MDGLNSYLGYLEINLPFFEVAGYDGSDKELVRLFDATKEFKCPDRIYTRQIAEFSDKYLFPSAYVQGDASSNASSDSSGDASGDALGDINTSGYASGDTEGDAEDGVSNMIEIASILRTPQVAQLYEQLIHDSLRPRGPRGLRRAWGSLGPRIIKGVATAPLVLERPQPSAKRHNREFLQKSRSLRLPGVTKWQRTKNDIGAYYGYMRFMTVVDEARNKESQGISEDNLSSDEFPKTQPPIGTGRTGKYPIINLNFLLDILGILGSLIFFYLETSR